MTDPELSENLPRENTFQADFLKSLEVFSDPSQKVKEAISRMKENLLLSPPDFSSFWEIRKICLNLFKELVNYPLRSSYWEEYIELTREGRRLKDQLDEETAFAVEQIELAITSLEKEIEALSKGEKAISIELSMPKTLRQNEEFYLKNAHELSLLNVYALQIHSLRKELIGQKLRLKHKNALFKRLSELGDHVFPRRREKVKEVSDLFMEDIDHFISEFFSPRFPVEKLKIKVFFLREEIKSLQGMAKVLCLNTHAFTATREKLSGAWDQLKGLEKEFKKEQAQHRETSKQNAALVQEKIAFFAEEVTQNPSLPDPMKKLDEIGAFMRRIELTRDDVISLKTELEQLRAPYLEKEKQEEEKRQKELQEKQRERKELFSSLKNYVKELKDNIFTLSIEQLEQEWAGANQRKDNPSFLKEEKIVLEKQLKELKDLIAEKKDQLILASLSQENLSALSQLKVILEERRSRRNEIKKHIEEIRKLSKASGLDFAKAMALSEQMEQEKGRLEKIEESIFEIEEKLKSDYRGL